MILSAAPFFLWGGIVTPAAQAFAIPPPRFPRASLSSLLPARAGKLLRPPNAKAVLPQSVLWDYQDRGDQFEKLEKEVIELGGVKADLAVVRTLVECVTNKVGDVREEVKENKVALELKVKENKAQLVGAIEKAEAKLTQGAKENKAKLVGAIEKVEAKLTQDAKDNKAELTQGAKANKAELAGAIEKVEGKLAGAIEKVEGKLTQEIKENKAAIETAAKDVQEKLNFISNFGIGFAFICSGAFISGKVDLGQVFELIKKLFRVS
jgi:hypothetical protein